MEDELKRLWRLYEGAIRRGLRTSDIRWELSKRGVTNDELWTFRIGVRRATRSERNR